VNGDCSIMFCSEGFWRQENSLRTGDAQYDRKGHSYLYVERQEKNYGNYPASGYFSTPFISSLSSSLLYMESTFGKLFYDFFAGNFCPLSVSDLHKV
jgi:hypothetical protein